MIDSHHGTIFMNSLKAKRENKNYMKTIEEKELYTIDELREKNLINGTTLRNLKLRQEYVSMVHISRGVKKKIIRERLANKYNMHVDTLEKILYSR